MDKDEGKKEGRPVLRGSVWGEWPRVRVQWPKIAPVGTDETEG